MIRPKLIIFAKAPVMGRAKTRLATDIGLVHAQRLYRSMSSRVIRLASGQKWDTELAITPAHQLGRIPMWDQIVQRPQKSGSLSPRLADVFSAKGPILVIGTDCPEVNRNDISQAFKALKSHDAVFGPAEDGGFWLIGLVGPVRPAIFYNIRWSSAYTLSDIKSNIGGPIAELRTLIDVDDGAALANLRSRSRSRSHF